MRYLIPLLLAPLAFAHPEDGTKPGDDVHAAVRTGNGAWSYEAVPHWGELPDGKNIGPTHGGVVVDDETGLIYVSTDSELSVIVYQPDGKFVKTIAPECQGFHAMAIRQEDGKAAIYGSNEADVTLSFRPLIMNFATLYFFIVYRLPPALLRETTTGITHLLAREDLKHPEIAVYPLEQIVTAHERVEKGANAKVLVQLPG